MASPLDRPLGRVAETLIKQFGAPCKLKRTTMTTDPETGAVSKSESTYAGKGIVEAMPQRLVDGVSVKQGDVRITLAARSFPIDPTVAQSNASNSDVSWQDSVEFAKVRYKVVHIDPVFSGEEVAVFTLVARK